MNLINQIRASLLADQHGNPRGIIGRLLGEQMVRQHMPETTWTISLLDIQPEDQILELGFGAGKAIELAAVQANNGHISGIEHQLPAPIHHSRLTHLIIGNTGICLQNERQSQDGRSNWWLAARLFSIQTGQLAPRKASSKSSWRW